MTATDIMMMAIWFGLLTGFAEICLLAIKKFFLDRIVRAGLDVVWMAPLADICLFAILGLILALISWRFPKLISVRMAVFVFTFFFSLSLLLMYFLLHQYARMLLAAGLAAQTGFWVAGHSHAFFLLIRRSIRWMVLIIIMLGVGVQVWQQVVERQALAKLPPAVADAPNVLLIVLDTVRAQSLSLHGYGRPTTPQLERLSKTGLVFERALSTSPWTLPSHASMFTGRWPHEQSTSWWTSLDPTYPTLAEVLAARGYETAGFVANTIYCSQETGLNRGFGHYEDYSVSLGQIILSSVLLRYVALSSQFQQVTGYHEIPGRKSASEINDAFLGWLSGKGKQPFFVFLNYYEAHRPYLPPPPFDTKFGLQKERNYFLTSDWMSSESSLNEVPTQELQAELNAYDGSIANLDQQLGLLFDELAKRRVLENTLVIITSDHGEEFANEHRLFDHGNSLYIQSLHVPLLILFPSRVPTGERVLEQVSLRDLPATVVDLLNYDDETRFPGDSLARYWGSPRNSDEQSPRPLLSEVNFSPNWPGWVPISKGDMRSLVVGQYHYIKNGDGSPELYDLKVDPLEENNMASSERGHQLVEQFEASMEKLFPLNR